METTVDLVWAGVAVVLATTVWLFAVEAALAWYSDSAVARWLVHRIEAVAWALPFGRRKAPGRRAGPPIHRAARYGGGAHAFPAAMAA